MTRKRDLSGFGKTAPSPAPAPRRPPPVPNEPLVPAPAPPSTPRSAPKKAKLGRKRITLSLPTAVASLLRKTAERESRIYLDIIKQAFTEESDAIDAAFIEAHRTGLASTLGGRRRADSGRTQIPLNILVEDLKELDRRAKALALDRSAYVTELLVRSLAH